MKIPQKQQSRPGFSTLSTLAPRSFMGNPREVRTRWQYWKHQSAGFHHSSSSGPPRNWKQALEKRKSRRSQMKKGGGRPIRCLENRFFFFFFPMLCQGHTNGGGWEAGGGKDDSMYQSGVAGQEDTCNVIYVIIPLKKSEKLNIYLSAVNFPGEDNK